jgi:hypothetical protein
MTGDGRADSAAVGGCPQVQELAAPAGLELDEAPPPFEPDVEPDESDFEPDEEPPEPDESDDEPFDLAASPVPEVAGVAVLPDEPARLSVR